MKIILVALSLIFTTSSVAYAVLNKWTYEKSVDDFDGYEKHNVSFITLLEEDFFGVGVYCDNDTPISSSVNFVIDNVIDSSSENRIRLKFDSQTPEWFRVDYLDNANMDGLFVNETHSYKKLVNKMKAHSTMKVEIYLYRQGRKIIPIDLRGFTEAFNKLPSYCQ